MLRWKVVVSLLLDVLVMATREYVCASYWVVIGAAWAFRIDQPRISSISRIQKIKLSSSLRKMQQEYGMLVWWRVSLNKVSQRPQKASKMDAVLQVAITQDGEIAYVADLKGGLYKIRVATQEVTHCWKNAWYVLSYLLSDPQEHAAGSICSKKCGRVSSYRQRSCLIPR